MNIPIYRAKKIDSDEYIYGAVSPCGKYILKHLSEHKMPYPMDNYYLTCHYLNYNEIDANTLSISFPNMIDKNGKKIFSQDSMEDARNVINSIFYDFESRICENCKWFSQDLETCDLNGDLISSPSILKCNSHERKTDGNVR